MRFARIIAAIWMVATPCHQVWGDTPLDDLIDQVARKLISEQNTVEGVLCGTWPNEEWATGCIAAGLVSAHERLMEIDYKTSAVMAGEYIARQSAYYGDSVYALVRINDIDSRGTLLPWSYFGRRYYELVEWSGIDRYIDEVSDMDPSFSMYDFAYHVIALESFEDVNSIPWRNAVISNLAAVNDDTADLPVQALALATWALAHSAPLDDQLIDPNASSESYWYGKTIADLPRLLLDHQIPEGEPDEGSFYWRFDHGDGNRTTVYSGYTEDCIYATHALLAVYDQYRAADPNVVLYYDPNLVEIEAAIDRATVTLAGAIQPDGTVSAHLTYSTDVFSVFAGELLDVLCEVAAYQEQKQLLLFPEDPSM